jgi:hypothetical protein
MAFGDISATKAVGWPKDLSFSQRELLLVLL